MKKSLISIVASTAIAGLVLTGCGSSGGSSNKSSSVPVAIQASIVTNVQADGLTIDHNNTECVNDVNVTAVGDNLQLNVGNMNLNNSTDACTILNEEFEIEVNPLLATTDEGVKLSDKVGIEPLKGFKGKKVNIFSTIAVETGVDANDFEEIDANSDNIKGIKNLLQLALANGAKAADMNATLQEVKAITKGDENATVTAINTLLATVGLPNTLTLEQMKTIEVKADENGTLKVSSTDGNLTAEIGQIQNKVEEVQNAKILNVNAISLTVGEKTYKGKDNNFKVTADTADVNSSDKVMININASAVNDYNLTDTTLKAVITNEYKSLTVTLDKVDIQAKDDKLSATVKTGATLALDSTYDGIDSVTGTLTKDVVTNDLSFDVDTLIDAITANKTAISTQKENILEALQKNGTYTLTVGIDANLSVVKDENLEDQNATLGAGYEGFTGTVTVNYTSEDNNTTTGGEDNNATTGGGDNNATGTIQGPVDSSTGAPAPGGAGDLAYTLDGSTLTVTYTEFSLGTNKVTADATGGYLYLVDEFLNIGDSTPYIEATITDGKTLTFDLGSETLADGFLLISTGSGPSAKNTYFPIKK